MLWCYTEGVITVKVSVRLIKLVHLVGFIIRMYLTMHYTFTKQLIGFICSSEFLSEYKLSLYI